jgi:pyruvate-formate lyase
MINKVSCDPFASALVEECLKRGKDYFKGGTLCASHLAMGGVGLGTATDSLSAIRKFVYEEKKLTIGELTRRLDSNFKDSEDLRIALDRSTSAYGNDIDRVDEIGARIYNTYCDEVFKYNSPENPVKCVNVLFSYTNHVFIGEVTEATPNGRMRGEVLSDAIGPSQGKDVEGPTKLINTVLKLDHSKVTGAFALNMKINSTLMKDEAGSDAIKALIKAYLAGGGPQIQFNFVDPDTLKEAQLHPEKHGDIVVRVAGYCEYFVNLDRTLQTEIINRTMHEL